jgi:hypothetical protein
MAGYDISLMLIIGLGIILGSVIGATYIWTTRTTNLQIQEPLTVTTFPTSIHTHPGQNETLDITIVNAATVTYQVTLTFTLNDTAYQTSYVTFSNQTYTVNPGTNYLTAWMATDKNASPADLQITTQFYRE